MARPRKHSDEGIIAATGRVIARNGPGFTLAEVAAEAGVATGTVMHRFGSKHGLLMAMTRAIVEGMRAAGGGHEDVVELIVDFYADLDEPSAAANNLAQLAVDLADPDLRALLAELHAALSGAHRGGHRAPRPARRATAGGRRAHPRRRRRRNGDPLVGPPGRQPAGPAPGGRGRRGRRLAASIMKGTRT